VSRYANVPRYAHCCHCRAPLIGRRANARFCDNNICRNRAARRRAAGVPEDTPRGEMHWSWHRARLAALNARAQQPLTPPKARR
jgi:hypothetical protein